MHSALRRLVGGGGCAPARLCRRCRLLGPCPDEHGRRQLTAGGDRCGRAGSGLALVPPVAPPPRLLHVAGRAGLAPPVSQADLAPLAILGEPCAAGAWAEHRAACAWDEHGAKGAFGEPCAAPDPDPGPQPSPPLAHLGSIGAESEEARTRPRVVLAKDGACTGPRAWGGRVVSTSCARPKSGSPALLCSLSREADDVWARCAASEALPSFELPEAPTANGRWCSGPFSFGGRSQN